MQGEVQEDVRASGEQCRLGAMGDVEAPARPSALADMGAAAAVLEGISALSIPFLFTYLFTCLFTNIYLFIWLLRVLVVACGIF